jgi:uncharacterized protein YciI
VNAHSSQGGGDLGPVLANLEPHLAHQEKLETNGTIFAAGPLSSDDGTAWDGIGLFVYRAESPDAAKTRRTRPLCISAAHEHSKLAPGCSTKEQSPFERPTPQADSKSTDHR